MKNKSFYVLFQKDLYISSDTYNAINIIVGVTRTEIKQA